MRIETSDINFDISKQLTEIQGSPYELEDFTTVVERRQVKPGLLTALFSAGTETVNLMTDTYRYDETQAESVLPSGKSYSGYGRDVPIDKPRQLRFAVPSFGLKLNTRPEDYAGRRRPGTLNEFLTEADVLGKQMVKANEAWDLFDELGYGTLLTADNNLVRGGPFETYDFYTEVHGSTRPAKINMQLSSSAVDHIQNFRDQRRLLFQDLERASATSNRFVCLCGDNFFDQRYTIEENTSLARDLNFEVDLASQPIPEDTFGGGTYAYPNFMGHDGILYINYGSAVVTGTKIIADNDAYLVPMGAMNFMAKAYAPARTRSYVNTEAQSMYTWSFTDERQGVTTLMESNVLFAMKNPRFIRALTTS